MSGELVEFLRARLAEDEQVARAAEGHAVFDGTGIVIHEGHLPSQSRTATLPSHVAAFIARHDPARVLREVEADRRLIEEWRDAEARRLYYERDGEEPFVSESRGYAEAMAKVLRIRARRFDTHPDYREEWRP